MEPHEQWRVDQAEADLRERERRLGFWTVVVGWGFVAFVCLLLGLILMGA